MTLYLGDCLDVLPTLPNGSADMVFCDLPYGVTANKWDTPIDLGALWHELLRVGKRNAAFVFTGTQPFSSVLVERHVDLFRYSLVWLKEKGTGFLNAKKRPLPIHEDILVFYVAQPTYNAQKTPGKPYARTRPTIRSNCFGGGRYTGGIGKTVTQGERYPSSALRVARDSQSGKRLHPTQKPVALLEWLVRTYTNPGDTVLDPTAGSGTTAVAAIHTGRQYVCIERDPTYFATMQRRVAETTTPPPQATLNFEVSA